ncbi:4-hydroxy-3-methylbut-2-enyl diphosphate reductase [Caulobacter sp. S45]|jgi:4-hydroxy-3-methylbut-2-enyl diphosphate reductase|uniref:4-hydroxy-3-methylbut-2-enyl diphosphate reductase n=1 Tax=Caulobacter sp. S45 TaxID=1641861 RepID=UPI00131BEA76|nr:4-hydroxy-3-methylbut-2-enyl diphosphate reductase [Caulobacter sp. S45]
MNAILPIRRPLTVILANPRGFCAGVDRAIQIVERAIQKYGAPVYVRHEIVHNHHVVARLRELGAVFVEELHECPDDRPVVFSAHGVPKSAPAEAERRNMFYLDATCPLVSKVHLDAERHHMAGREIVLIGHAGHPEVDGTLGQLPDGAIKLVETVGDVAFVQVSDPDKLAFVTQTTLSMDDTADIITALKARFPNIVGPHGRDICYATTNRQEAIKTLSPGCDLVLVVGSSTSSNSQRLVEVAMKAGAQDAKLIDDADMIQPAWFEGVSRLGLSAGASAPEVLVEGVLDWLAARFDLSISTEETARETVIFKLPRVLVEETAAQ